MKAERMMKWRVRRQSKCNRTEVNEDVRRSLEILDNVLAEFDDNDVFPSTPDSVDIVVNGDEQEIPLSHAHQEKERWADENGNKLEQSELSRYSVNGHLSPEGQSSNDSLDGTTSQNPSVLDESRRCPAPPVPKRSPETRLSNRDRPFFPKAEDDKAAQTYGGHHSLGSLQLSSQNGSQSFPEISEEKRKAALSAPTLDTSSFSSPADHSSQISGCLRHGEITGEDSCLEFYLIRDGDEADDEVFISSPRRAEADFKCKAVTCRVCGVILSPSASVSIPAVFCDTPKPPMDSTKPGRYAEAHLRRMRLDKKFAKVKMLLKTNQVSGLDAPPPSFKPPAPPLHHNTTKTLSPVHGGGLNMSVAGSIGNRSMDSHLEKTANNKISNECLTKPLSGIEPCERTPSAKGSAHPEMNKSNLSSSPLDQESAVLNKSSSALLSGDVACSKCEKRSRHKTSTSCGGELSCSSDNQKHIKKRSLGEIPADTNVLPTDVLCKNCINKGWTFRSTVFVSQSPNSLKRPPLGLSYSMEDDLSPGIKEISSSSPKAVDAQNDSLLSSAKSSPATHLSTFSHSASSLGDGSSQSDLDFSTSLDSGKVPLTTIKSLTLPTDMKLGPSPFYCATEGEHVNGTDRKLGVSSQDVTRSSSAPPPSQDRGNWKKDKTGFSKKEKQSINDAVDSGRVGQEEEATGEAKPKKRSVWKSILRRK